MPPAFVLSQNQTLKLMFDQTPAGIRESKTGISGSRSCTKNHKTGVFAFLRHMSSAPKRTSTQIHKERHKFDRPADTQRLSVTGPPPTCPFIFNRQCQRADAHPLPVRLFRASVVPTKKRHETNARPVSRPRPLAGGAVYVWASDASTGFLQFYCNSPFRLLGAPLRYPSLLIQIGPGGPVSRPSYRE